MVVRPVWWDWELELSPHVLKRMADRCFNETDLRAMIQDAGAVRPDLEPGRWVIETRLGQRPWEVIVEPVAVENLVVVVTAYPLG